MFALCVVAVPLTVVCGLILLLFIFGTQQLVVITTSHVFHSLPRFAASTKCSQAGRSAPMQTTVRTGRGCTCRQVSEWTFSRDDENGRTDTLSVHQVGVTSVVLGYTQTPQRTPAQIVLF
jgi:hypothetical protein